MKLTLTNFRCYPYKEFIFPDNGLTLLSGPSGRGKSSIINAIIFVLFGIGKKLCLRGTKSCNVEMEYLTDDGLIYIKRSKTPNRLILVMNDETYEDIVAQEIIDSIFGKNFPEISFVDNRNLYKTFLMLTPSEKIKFLEGFALRKTDLGLIKNKIKEEIHKNNMALSEIKIKIRNTKDTLEQFEEPEEVVFPLKYKDRDKCISNEKVKLKNTGILLKRKEKEISQLREEISSVKEKLCRNECNNELISQKEDELAKIEEKISSLETPPMDREILYRKERLVKLKKMLEGISLKENVILLREKVEDTEKREKDELRTKILALKEKVKENPKEIRDTLAVLYQIKPKITDYEKDKLTMRKYEDISTEDVSIYEDKISHLESSLDGLKKDLNLAELREESMNCPKCNTVLYLDRDKLVEIIGKENDEKNDEKNDVSLNKEEIVKKINSSKKELVFLKKSLDELNRDLSAKVKTEENISKNETFIKEKGYDVKVSSKKIEEEILKLEGVLAVVEKDIFIIQDLETKFKKGELSLTLRDMKKELENKEKRLEEIPPITEEISSEEIMIEEKDLEFVIKNRDEVNTLIEKAANLEDELIKLRNKLENISNDDLLEMNDKLTILNKEWEDLKLRNKTHKGNVETIERFLEYSRVKKTFDTIREKIKGLEDEENILVKKYEAGITLKEKVLVAESMCIKNIIENINKFTNYYLSKFFIEDTMEIELVSFKENTTSKAKGNVNKENLGKPTVHVKLFFNGEECDLTSISGGELSRLILAFTLALNEIFESPMILLDETTANLDDINTQNVFECIEEHFKDKFVLVSAHQVVEGSYENVVYL